MTERTGLWPEDDADFMSQFRRAVDDFLVLGYAPADGAPVGRSDHRAAMREQLGAHRYDLLRRSITEMRPHAKELVARAGANAVMVQYPPPAVAGAAPVIETHLLDAVTWNPLWRRISKEQILDVIDHTIGAIKSGVLRQGDAPQQQDVTTKLVKGFVFIAMPMLPDDPGLEDVHHTIKEVAQGLGLAAQRVDDPASNQRITDRVLKSLAEAEFIVADLTHARPNVYFEAGIAQGHGKVPIYIAREGTKIEFDLKDYPVIFFRNLRELREGLAKRLSGLLKEGR